MKKATKILLLSGIAVCAAVGVGALLFVKKIRSAEYAYTQSLEARAKGDGDTMLRWLSVAGARGDVRAQLQLAVGFETGVFGGVKDEKIAAAWYEKAANAGNAVAQFNYGTFCWTGRGGVPVNREEAVAWWEKSSQNGILNAKTNLGICYRDGIGTAKDLDKARDLFIEAAAGNHREAQYQLGQLFESENNRERALYWLEKAASGGHEKAQKRFEQLTGTHL